MRQVDSTMHEAWYTKSTALHGLTCRGGRQEVLTVSTSATHTSTASAYPDNWDSGSVRASPNHLYTPPLFVRTPCGMGTRTARGTPG